MREFVDVGYAAKAPGLKQLAFYFLRLGAVGFGGPVALANRMRHDLCEEKQWLSADEYNEGLAIASTCPGPLAYQLAVYIGYILKGTRGALVVAFVFAVAPFCFVTAVAALYSKFAGSWQLKAVFYGVSPCVVAIVFKSCFQLSRKVVTRRVIPIAIAVLTCAVTVILQRELMPLLLGAGFIGVWLLKPDSGDNAPAAPKSRLQLLTLGLLVALIAAVSLIQVNGSNLPVVARIFAFFFRTGLMIFGSGLVIVPFLKEYLVDQFHWLSSECFMDAVAVGLSTPGPVVITATFVGYIMSGFAGALAATIGIFAPAVLFTIVCTPLFRAYRNNKYLKGFTAGITLAVVGVLFGTCVMLASVSIKDVFALVVSAFVLFALFKIPKLPEPALILLSALSGLLWSMMFGIS